MARYSRVHIVGNRRFRYDYQLCELQYIAKADKKVIKENKEWRDKFGEDLFEIVDGYMLIDTIGLSKDGWEKSPDYWCDVYNDRLNEEIAYMIKEI